MSAMTILQLNYDAAGIALVCSPLFAGMACSYRLSIMFKIPCASEPCPRQQTLAPTLRSSQTVGGGHAHDDDSAAQL